MVVVVVVAVVNFMSEVEDFAEDSAEEEMVAAFKGMVVVYGRRFGGGRDGGMGGG